LVESFFVGVREEAIIKDPSTKLRTGFDKTIVSIRLCFDTPAATQHKWGGYAEGIGG
jgi:hypothetical protein